MRWVTRSRPKTDRIACPWLLRRFIDQDAQSLFLARPMTWFRLLRADPHVLRLDTELT
jgi:hypothetical protein